MHLDGLRRDEQRLRDVTVGLPFGREHGDAALARRQRAGPGERRGPRPGPRRVELRAHMLNQRSRATCVGQLERPPERVARVRRLASSRSVEPSAASAFACSRRAGEPSRASTASSSSSRPSLRRSVPSTRSARPSVQGAPQARARPSSSSATAIASSRRPSRSSACAFSDRQGPTAGLMTCGNRRRDRLCRRHRRLRVTFGDQ